MIRVLTENFGWKLLSLVIAVLLWLAVVGGPDLASSISAPVVFRNLPKDMEISSDLIDRVRLEIRGPSGRLSTSALSNTAAVVDLAGVTRPGERTFTITQENVNLPSDVVLERAVPAQIRLQLERRVWREAPVRVRLAAPPPRGYRVARQEVRPQRLMLVGPESRVNRIDHVETDPVDLSSAVGEAAFQVHTYVSDPYVRFDSQTVVAVRMTLERIPDEGQR